MGFVQKTKTQAVNLVTDFRDHWNTPKDGYYVSYKEFTNFVIGAGATNVAAYSAGNLSFTAGCMFVGAIYGLKMMDFAMMGIVGLILGYLFSPINMIITDNLGSPPKKTMRMINIANLIFTVLGIACFFVPQNLFEGFMPALPQIVGTKFLIQVFSSYYNILVLRKLSPKFGKYRSWIVAGIVPYVLTLILLTWFPFDTLAYHDKFWVMNLIFSFWGCFGTCFGQIPNIQNVISPNTQERTNIMSFGSFLYSLFPSIYNIVFPVIAATVGGMTDLRTYRYIVPIFVIVAAPFALFLVFGVKDRVVQEQEHKPEVNMRKGFKEVLRNKYLWITNISGWLGSFGVGVINVVNILIIYSMRREWVLGLTATILGTAWTPGMLLAPILIKKFGKKRIMLFGKYISVLTVFISVAGVFANSLVIIILATYISTMITSLVGIVSTSMTADIWDYQQYISGERLDGCMGIFGYISAPLTTITALFVPAVYAMFGFTSDWNILYDTAIRNNIFLVTFIIGAVSGLIGTIPYHFYDLTEEKHAKIIDSLKERAEKKALEREENKEAAYVLNGEAKTKGAMDNE